MTKITKEQRARIVERYRVGENATQLADLHGLSAAYVRKIGARPGMGGFRGMKPETRRKIAAMGGRASHELGTAHTFTPDEAREAGRKGGRSLSRDREHMAKIGRVGGKKSKRGGAR